MRHTVKLLVEVTVEVPDGAEPPGTNDLVDDLRDDFFWSIGKVCNPVVMQVMAATPERAADILAEHVNAGRAEGEDEYTGQHIIRQAAAAREIAVGLGVQEEWSSDELEWIPGSIADSGLRHPGDSTNNAYYQSIDPSGDYGALECSKCGNALSYDEGYEELCTPCANKADDEDEPTDDELEQHGQMPGTLRAFPGPITSDTYLR